MSSNNPKIGRRSAIVGMLAAPLLLSSCGQSAGSATPPGQIRPVATLLPTRATQATPAPGTADTGVLPDDTGWLAGEAGIELRRLRMPAGEQQARVPLTIVRMNPAEVALRVAYDPAQPRVLRSWFATEQPTLAINGGYFTAEQRSAALVISDGAASGESYAGFGGMLAVHADGAVELRPLRDTPYDPAEALAQATQSAPMLVFPGGRAAELEDDGERARRSAVAIDQSGRLLAIVSPTSGLTLRDLAGWLAGSDLAIDRALNLDGGSSTGLFLASGELSEAIDSFSPLPIVILADRRKSS